MENFLMIESLDPKQQQDLVALFQQVQWPRTEEEIDIMLTTSLSFGVVGAKTQKLLAYARVITDKIKHAFIFDVVVDETSRNQGLGKMLIQFIIAHPELKRVTHFNLTSTPESIKFYERLGFNKNSLNADEEKLQSLRLSKERQMPSNP